MRLNIRSKLLVLAGIGLLLAGLGGCDPGPIVWKADAAPAEATP